MELRKVIIAGADAVQVAEGNTDRSYRLDRISPAGVVDQGMFAMGPLETWEIPFLPPTRGGCGQPLEMPRPLTGASPSAGAKADAGVVLTGEGQPKPIGMRDGKSEWPIRPLTQGKPPRATLPRKGATGQWNRWRAR